MLFRATIALFALFYALQSPTFAAGEGGSDITVVGPTKNSAAFIAVRPVSTQMQPEVRQTQPMSTETLAQPIAEEPQTQTMTYSSAVGDVMGQMGGSAFAAGEGTAQGSEITVVGPTENSAGFIAVRPVSTQIQSEVRPIQPMTSETLPQTTIAGSQAQTETEIDAGGGVNEQMGGAETASEMPAGLPVTFGGKQTHVQPGESMLVRPPLTASSRVMPRRAMRGRRLQRGAATMEQPGGRTETTNMEIQWNPVTAMERPTRTERASIQRPTTERTMKERPTMEYPTVVRPMMELPMMIMERPMMERPPITPETEEVTPAASVMLPRGKRLRIIGDIEVRREGFGREDELGRGRETQWEQVWIPRRRSVRF